MLSRRSPFAAFWLYLAGVILPVGGLVLALSLLTGRVAGHVAGWHERALPEAASTTEGAASTAPPASSSAAPATVRPGATATAADSLNVGASTAIAPSSSSNSSGAAASGVGTQTVQQSQPGTPSGQSAGNAAESPAQRATAPLLVEAAVAGVQVGPLLGQAGGEPTSMLLPACAASLVFTGALAVILRRTP
jgi:hypothetical protein